MGGTLANGEGGREKTFVEHIRAIGEDGWDIAWAEARGVSREAWWGEDEAWRLLWWAGRTGANPAKAVVKVACECQRLRIDRAEGEETWLKTPGLAKKLRSRRPELKVLTRWAYKPSLWREFWYRLVVSVRVWGEVGHWHWVERITARSQYSRALLTSPELSRKMCELIRRELVQPWREPE